MSETTHDTLQIPDLPMAARIARRGRPIAHVSAEVRVSASTWSRLEEGDLITLPSLLRVVGYLGMPLVITPDMANHPWAKNESLTTEELEEEEDHGE